MKLNKFVVAMGLGVALVSGAATAADEGHGTITFEGSIIDAPCSIKGDQVDQTVKMGQVNTKILANGGKSSPETFSIKLTDCVITDPTAVSITFAGATSAETPNNLALVGTTVKGASLAITDEKLSPIKIGQKTELKDILEGDNTLTFGAYLQGDGASTTIVPGAFKTVANFQLAYE